MDDPGVVAERGVLTAPAEVWQLAVRRAEVIGRLSGGDAVGHAAAAAELGISRRQVYELLRRWWAGSGVVSDLVPGKSSPDAACTQACGSGCCARCCTRSACRRAPRAGTTAGRWS